jgi:hypothetical protein
MRVDDMANDVLPGPDTCVGDATIGTSQRGKGNAKVGRCRLNLSNPR